LASAFRERAAMIPRKVALSCNASRYYLEFWEPVSRLWKHKCGLEPYLFFIGDEKDVPPHEHGTVVCVPRVHGIPEHTQAQWARFFFTQTDLDAVWITSDIDMFPLSKSYFLESSRPYADDCFVSLNSNMRDLFPVCYNVATGRVFKEVLGFEPTFALSVRALASATSTYQHIVNGDVMENWGADEQYSSRKICEFRRRHPQRSIQLRRPGGFHNGRRIDRVRWSYRDRLVKKEAYIDCHSLRPYSEHRQEIEALLALALRPQGVSAVLASWKACLSGSRA
jgi:hypothetical protein